MRTITTTAWIVAGLVAFDAVAQVAPARPKGPETIKIGSITVQGSFRSRLEMWDWFEAEGNNSYAFLGNQFRLGFGQSSKQFDWLFELEAPVLLGLPDDAVAAGAQGQLGLGGSYFVANNRHRNTGMVFAKQAFVRFKGEEHALRIGRFDFMDGGESMPADATLAWMKRERITQRLIGPFAWSHTGRSFDGAQYTWTRGKTNVTAVGALPTRGAFQTDGWGNLDVAIGYGALTRQHATKNSAVDWRVFGLYYKDWRRVLKTDNRPAAARQADGSNIDIGSFGGHLLYRGTTKAGTFDVLGWAVGQTGSWGALDHSANAFAAEAGWQPAVLPKLRPWIRAGYFRGSGDDNPLDGNHGTFFQVLPTPRPYARMPFFNFQNNEDFMGMVVLRPHKAVTIRPEVHWLRLTERGDLWYQGGGAFQPWTFGFAGRTSNGNRGLATMYDVSADYNVNAHLTVSAYLAHVQGHSVIRSIYPRGPQGNFGYLELMYRF